MGLLTSADVGAIIVVGSVISAMSLTIARLLVPVSRYTVCRETSTHERLKIELLEQDVRELRAQLASQRDALRTAVTKSIEVLDARDDLLRRVTEDTNTTKSWVGDVARITVGLVKDTEALKERQLNMEVGKQFENHMCSICMTKKVNCARLCGHVFCNGCLDKIPGQECPHCRKEDKGHIPIYFS